MSLDEREMQDVIARGHEPIATDVRAVWRTAAAIVGVVLAVFILIVGLMKSLATVETNPASGDAAKPDLNWAEQNPLQQLRSQEQAMLDSYGWIDREAGIARIPVDRAIDIIAQNGLPSELQHPSASGSNSMQQPEPAGSRSADVENNER